MSEGAFISESSYGHIERSIGRLEGAISNFATKADVEKTRTEIQATKTEIQTQANSINDKINNWFWRLIAALVVAFISLGAQNYFQCTNTHDFSTEKASVELYLPRYPSL